MTPIQLARQFCANFDESGCAGLGIAETGQTIRLWPHKPACTIGTSERCLYFERCVAPQVRTLEQGPHRDSWLESVNLYLRRLPESGRPQAKVNIFGKTPDERLEHLAASRKCPECGNPMAARRRLCESCARAKRREAARLGMAASRMAVNS